MRGILLIRYLHLNKKEHLRMDGVLFCCGTQAPTDAPEAPVEEESEGGAIWLIVPPVVIAAAAAVFFVIRKKKA